MQVVERKPELEEKIPRWVGATIKRLEDPRLLTGNDRFVDNLKFQKMVYAGFVRSPLSHATIKKIDVSKIMNKEEVVAILTPEEVKSNSNPVPVIWRPPSAKLHEHYALAQDKVLHVGDPVLAVAVRRRENLEDIIDLVQVEYGQVLTVLDPMTAETSPPIHEELKTNLCCEVAMTKGDIEKAIQEASAVVSSTFEIPRLAASPMETRGVIAIPSGEHGILQVYSSTQWPHELRTLLASCLKIPANKLRVIGPDVGGGFGVKGELFSEEVAVPLLALKCGFPVKWIESRRESFLATTHARGQRVEATASFTKEGLITGLKVKLVSDFGAYLHTITPGCCVITAISLNGPYKIQNFSVLAKGVYTNKVSLSAYRGFGQPEAAFVVERLMSMAAEKLGMDQSEIRFKNLIKSSEMPYTTVSGGMYDSGDFEGCLRKALDVAGYEEMMKQRRIARRAGKLVGVGVSIYTETSGFAPGFVFQHLGITIGGFDSATVKIDPQGKLSVTTGAFPHGQGFDTTLSQICADELGLDLEDVFSFHGDTDSSPYGQGTFGSRTVAVAGTAAVMACKKLKEKIKRIAAHMLKDEDDLFISQGYVHSKSNTSKKISISEVARAAYRAYDLPKGMEPGLEATAAYDPVGLVTSYAAHISQIEIDRETGKIGILKHVSVHDCGNQINPKIVEGQIQGGLIQAIGSCLLEEIVYDGDGQILSGSLADYLIPTAESVPNQLFIDSTCTPTPINPLGAKGVGESATIIAPASIVNAVSDAISGDLNLLPLTPERVWKEIQAKAKR